MAGTEGVPGAAGAALGSGTDEARAAGLDLFTCAICGVAMSGVSVKRIEFLPQSLNQTPRGAGWPGGGRYQIDGSCESTTSGTTAMGGSFCPGVSMTSRSMSTDLIPTVSKGSFAVSTRTS